MFSIRLMLRIVPLCLAAGVAVADDRDFYCVIEPHIVVEVSSPVEGVVDSISVEKSDTVEKGQPLVQLESAVERAAVAQARAKAGMDGELRAKQAAVEFAERKRKRMDELFSNQAISTHEKDEVQTELTLARMQARQAREEKQLAGLELAKAVEALNRRTIRSPISGVVVDRYLAPGEFVDEQPILKLAQLDPLRVEVVVPASMFGEITSGSTAEVIPEIGRGDRHIATVTVVDRVVDAASGTFGVRLELPNPDYRLPGGLECHVRFGPATAAAAEKLRPGRVGALGATPSGNELTASSQAGRAPGSESSDLPPAVPDSGEAGAGAPPAVGFPAQLVAEPATNEIPGGNRVSEGPASASGPEPADVIAVPAAVRPSRGAATEVTPTAAGATVCRSVGALSEEDAARLGVALAPLGATVTSRTQRVGAGMQYVVLASPGQGQSVSELAGELRGAGIEDMAVLARGQYAGKVSLGVYSSASFAEKRRREISLLDLAVDVGTIGGTRDALRLDFEVPPDLADENTLGAFIGDVLPGVPVEVAGCGAM